MLRFTLALALLVGCTDERDDPVSNEPLWGVQWGKTTLKVGEQTFAGSVIEDSYATGEPGMPARGTTWATSDSGVLTLIVSSDHSSVTLTGAAVGSATVVAGYGEKTTMQKIEVVAAP